MDGLANILEKLGELADAGMDLSRTGEVDISRGSSKDPAKGVFGFSVKMGLGDDKVRVQPFGNVHREPSTGRVEVREQTEPPVDVFEEEDHLLVVAEMPGVGIDDVRWEIEGDVLIISAESGSRHYRREILLPNAVDRADVSLSGKNGVFELRCQRGSSEES
jgi:HSP20 family protein